MKRGGACGSGTTSRTRNSLGGRRCWSTRTLQDTLLWVRGHPTGTADGEKASPPEAHSRNHRAAATNARQEPEGIKNVLPFNRRRDRTAAQDSLGVFSRRRFAREGAMPPIRPVNLQTKAMYRRGGWAKPWPPKLLQKID